jgi:hypothetical protein
MAARFWPALLVRRAGIFVRHLPRLELARVFLDEIHRELDGIGENQVTCIDPGLSVTLVEGLWQGYGSLSQFE